MNEANPAEEKGVGEQVQVEGKSNDDEKTAFEREERRLKLANLNIDLWVKPLSFISAIIAFSLALFTINAHLQQNQKTENERLILEEKIDLNQTPLNKKSSLLSISVTLENKGGDTIKPYAHALVPEKLYKNEGLYLIVYEISTQPNRLIDADEGEVVYGPYNMLEKYANKSRNWYESYRIKPHTIYHEGEAIILERKKLYQILARFFVLSGEDSGWTITESRYVYVE